MNFRSRDDIFLPEHHYLFDYEAVESWCRDNAYAVTRPEHLVELVRREDNPFIREYKAGLAHEAYWERAREDRLQVTYEQMEDFDMAISRIVRDCRVEETVYLWKKTEGDAPAGEAAPTLQERKEASEAVERNLERIREDLEQVKAQIAQLMMLQEQPYCCYISPTSPRPRDEVESDLRRTSKDTATVFAACLKRLEQQGCLCFGNDRVRTIFDYLKERYRLPYGYPNFSAVFSSRRKKI